MHIFLSIGTAACGAWKRCQKSAMNLNKAALRRPCFLRSNGREARHYVLRIIGGHGAEGLLLTQRILGERIANAILTPTTLRASALHPKASNGLHGAF